jgi:hypothetical protein
MKQILLITIGLSVALWADFSRDNSTQIVTDSITGLQWQDNSIGSTMPWEEAIAHCKALELDTHSDWRLPNINELKTIIDRSKVSPAIVDGFTNTSSGSYWSSSTYEGDKRYAWDVYFYSGYTSSYGKGNSTYVRCVRVGQ